ncbi:hypothetical protein Tco_0737565 [Tanacetum coccineum]|uniref:Reverse transcriptase domain-containing protein n=1 Tax=Tanacetum coccineum TaxID=301880 RepID=A0ABQ5FM49_9ASTR
MVREVSIRYVVGLRKRERTGYEVVCSNDHKVKYTAGSFVGKALTWWNSQIRTVSREVDVSMSWNDFKFMMIATEPRLSEGSAESGATEPMRL